jgi:pilus assembly protein CpaF
LEISEVLDFQEGEIHLQPLFLFREEGEEAGCVKGSLKKQNRLYHREKLTACGMEGGFDG